LTSIRVNASVVERRITSDLVIGTLAELFAGCGAPEYVRSDNSPEFTAKAVRKWLRNLGSTTLFIEPGSPWKNGYVESFNGRMRDELLNGEIFDTVYEAQVLTEQWRQHYNRIRPHSSLVYRPPAPEATEPKPRHRALAMPVAGIDCSGQTRTRSYPISTTDDETTGRKSSHSSMKHFPHM